jgi:ATP/maltotriose-dependent transcriptional regulator MalT
VIPLAESHNQPGLQATGYHLLAQLWDLRGDYTQMERALAQALALVEDEPHLRWSVIWGRIHRAYVDMRWNQLVRAEQRLHQLNAELTNRQAFHSHWLSVQVGLGLVSTFQQNLPEAMRYFEQVWVNLKDLYASNYVVIYLSRARLNRMRGDLEASRQDVVQALLFAGKRGMLADYISAVVEAARYDRASGQPLQTVALLAEMEVMAGQADLRPACLSVRQALIRAFTQAERPEEAARYRRLAITDRDAIAASIPQPEDRVAYLARRDLRSLDEPTSRA